MIDEHVDDFLDQEERHIWYVYVRWLEKRMLAYELKQFVKEILYIVYRQGMFDGAREARDN